MMTIELVEERGTEKELLVRDGAPLMTLALSRTSLISNRLYLWIVLHKTPTRGQLREFKRRFAEIFSGFTILCNVDPKNKAALRFAQAFGFTVQSAGADILLLERAV